jgi:predicted TIM-barrel fold metal-dependent hydrolase
MVTTSGWFAPATLRCAIDALGVDRVLYATDYPFRGFEEEIKLVENTPLTHEEKEKIYFRNAERLLGL